MAVAARQLDTEPRAARLRAAEPTGRGARGAAERSGADARSAAAPRSGRNRRPYVSVVALLLATVFAVSALQAYVGQEGLRVAELEQRVGAAEERLVLLRAKQAQLSSPSRLAEVAAEAGLVGDPDPTFLAVPDGQVAERPPDRTHSALKRLTSQQP